jgi:rhodanese-related sulfurtransferase
VTVEQLLALARSRVQRLAPAQAQEACRAGALLVDIRAESQRARDGLVPDALFIARNVLEWRCDPASRWRDPAASDPQRQTIVMCDEGYQSSLAAATLIDLGLPLACDLVGGFQAWRRAGLPVEVPGGGTGLRLESPRGEPQPPISNTILPSLPPPANRS